MDRLIDLIRPLVWVWVAERIGQMIAVVVLSYALWGLMQTLQAWAERLGL